MVNHCLIIAGEKSGEEHALTFFDDLKKYSPDTIFFGVGGDRLKSKGVELLYHLNDFSSMGFSEVVGKIPFYFSAMNKICAEVKKRNVRSAILIDFQDFNLRLAKRLKKLGVEVLYYVAPQAWAWRSNRAQIIARTVNTLFCILPFEKKWFQDRGVKNIVSVSHPVWNRFHADLSSFSGKTQKPAYNIVILPGSRRAEISYNLPIFIQALRRIKKTIPIHVTLIRASNLDPKLFHGLESIVDDLEDEINISRILVNQDLALATSGTITLVTALFRVPTIVGYRTSLFNQFVFENFIKYEGAISLPNLIIGERTFPELTQDGFTPEVVEERVLDFLQSKDKLDMTRKCLKSLAHMLSQTEVNVAEYMGNIINAKD